MGGLNSTTAVCVLISVCLLFFFPAAGAAPAAKPENIWDMEKAVAAALRQSDAVIRAKEDLYQKELELKMARAVAGGRIGVGGSVTAVRTPGEDFQVAGRQEAMIELPLTARLKVGAKMTVGEPVTVSLDYQPLAEDLAVAGAQRALALEELRYKKTMVEIELEARQKYINMLSAIKARRRAEEQLAVTEEYLRIVKRRFELGMVSEADLKKAEGELLRAQIQLKKTTHGEETARLNFSRFLYTDLSQVEFKELPEFPSLYAPEDVLLENALANNVAVKQARLQLEAARADLAGQKKNQPVLSLGVTTESPGPVFSAGLSWALEFTGPRKVEIARLQVEQRERALQAAVTGLEDALARAAADFELQLLSMTLLEHQWQEAERAYRGMQIRFAAGELLPVDLERARLVREEAFHDYLEGWHNTWNSWYTLLAVIAA